MWFAMMFMALLSLIYSSKYLRSNNLSYDFKAEAFSKVGLVFGVLGILTGSIWAKFIGDWWVIEDVKLNGAAVTVLIYLAYFSLNQLLKKKVKELNLQLYIIFCIHNDASIYNGIT